MDSRDSSSSQSTPPSNRDTSPSASSSAAEDDAILSVAAALAKDAALHFQSRRFVECLSVLYQLKQKKEDDPKVLHNIAIAEYFRDGCSDPRRLLEVLKNVKKKSEALSQASGEQAETNAANKATKGSGTAQQLSSANSSSLVFMDEFDPSVATLNIAIIWFHLHEYKKASSVLEPLYHNIEPIDETTALHVCLLLLDVALACQDASKSADILIYLEKAFGVGCVSQCDNGSATQQQSTNPVTKPSSLTTNSSAIDSSNSDLASTGNNALENSLSRTLSLSEETLEYETMFSLDIGGQNLTRPTDLSRAQIDKSMSSMDLKLKLQLYKVRFLLLTRNLKHAKREVKLAMNIARGRDSSTALLLKSQLEYARGNDRKAIKLLNLASNRTESGNSTMYNNLGCIYFRIGNYHTSSALFTKALSSSSSARKDKQPLKLATFSQDKALLITYNCGIQYLACGKPLLAARCFQKASLVFYDNPIVWLRVAECCLMALEKGLLNSTDRTEITVYVIGKGKWRYLAIENGTSRSFNVDSDGQLKLSLSLARQSLVNALYLLENSGANQLKSSLPSSICLDDTKANGDGKEQKGGATSQEIMQNSISLFEDFRRRENQIIKQAILADLAFTELELENPSKALAAAKSLLELPESSRIYTFLGRVYEAEALCLLNKRTEAAECLSTYLSTGTKIEIPFSVEDSELWRVEKMSDCDNNAPSSPDGSKVVFLKPEEAQGALYANFAAIYAAKGEIERAQSFVTNALALVPNSAEATLTAVYLDIVLGKTEAAVSKLKQCSRVKFLPSRVKLNKA